MLPGSCSITVMRGLSEGLLGMRAGRGAAPNDERTERTGRAGRRILCGLERGALYVVRSGDDVESAEAHKKRGEIQ